MGRCKVVIIMNESKGFIKEQVRSLVPDSKGARFLVSCEVHRFDNRKAEVSRISEVEYECGHVADHHGGAVAWQTRPFKESIAALTGYEVDARSLPWLFALWP